MTPAPHTMTPDELLRFHDDSLLAAPLREALEQLEQAGKALTAARTLQGAAENLAAILEPAIGSGPGTAWHKLQAAIKAFEDTDDGELGS